MRTGLVLKYIGMALLLESLFLLISAAVSAYNGFDKACLPLAYSCLITGILGGFPNIFVKSGEKLSVREGYLIVTGSWLLCCIFGSLPYFLYDFSFSEAVFESVSGFTTTGASVIDNVEVLPQGLLFWRMSTAWIGGIGIIAMFSLVVPAGGNRRTISNAEASDIAAQYSSPRKRWFFSGAVHTYIVLTVIVILALRIGGMRWFDAVCHAMSACSTCGFSTRNASIAAFDSPLLETILAFAMIAASIRFGLLGGLFQKGGIRRLLKSEITRTFLCMILAGTLLMTIDLHVGKSYGTIWECLREAWFQVSSIFTTTGFATADTNVWPNLSRALLVAGSLVCGCSGSTSGGMKVDRLVVIFKSVWVRVVRMDSPNQVVSFSVEGRQMDSEKVTAIFTFASCYMAIICAGAIMYSATGIDMISAWSAAVACISNVGPGMGEVGSMSNYAFMPAIAKWNSVVLMLLGRLEIFPILAALRIRRH